MPWGSGSGFPASSPPVAEGVPLADAAGRDEDGAAEVTGSADGRTEPGPATGVLSAGLPWATFSPPLPPPVSPGIIDTASATTETSTAAASMPPRSTRALLAATCSAAPTASGASGRPGPRRTSAARRRRSR